MKLETEKILEELTALTLRLKEEAVVFLEKDLDQLNHKRTKESWSALECIDHLVQYGDFYIEELNRSIRETKSAPVEKYKVGWLGNYFAKMMIPEAGMKTLKSPKDKVPRGSSFGFSVLHDFIKQQDELVAILKKAKQVHLGKAKCSITLSKMVKLKLGDTLRFVIYHNWRHVEQAKRALTTTKSLASPQTA